MTANVTPVAQYDTATIVRTVDGELWSDASGPAPYATWMQLLADRTLYARGALWGILTWSGQFSVDAGGSSTVFTVRVGIIEAVTLRDSSNVWRPYFVATETELHLADVSPSAAALANNTWYYVYVYSDGTTTPRFQIHLDPPTESAAPTVVTGYKRGQTANYRYLGCFRTNGSGVPLAMRADRGHYTYHPSVWPSDSDTDTPGGSSMLSDLTVGVPPHARTASLLLVPSTAAVTLKETGWGGGYGIGTSGYIALPSHVLTATQRLEWTGASGAQLVVNVLGFREAQ